MLIKGGIKADTQWWTTQRVTYGGHSEFPRGSVHHHRPRTPERPAGQKRWLRPRGQFAEIRASAAFERPACSAVRRAGRRPSFLAFFLGDQEKGLAEGMGTKGREGLRVCGQVRGQQSLHPPPTGAPGPGILRDLADAIDLARAVMIGDSDKGNNNT